MTRPATVPAAASRRRKAPFIEQAQANGELYIHQPYELYSDENHDTWRRLYARMEARWRRYANPRFLRGRRQPVPRPEHGPAARGRQPLPRARSPASRPRPVSGYVPRLPVLRLPAQPRVPDHDHDPRRQIARLPARARHLPRHRRPRADAHRPGLRRRAGPLRRAARTPRPSIVAEHQRRARARSARLDQHHARRWRASSGSRSSSA